MGPLGELLNELRRQFLKSWQNSQCWRVGTCHKILSFFKFEKNIYHHYYILYTGKSKIVSGINSADLFPCWYVLNEHKESSGNM